jgi:cytochrome c-type biogenesis protein CcmE
MFKGKLKFIIAIVIITGALSYLVFSGVKDTMVYYLTIDELQAKVPDVYGERVRVSGTVVPGTIVKDNTGKLEFQLTDGNNKIDVKYSGIVPDVFADDVEAVVEGSYTQDNVFNADVLLAKCPTKYESDEKLYESQKGSS